LIYLDSNALVKMIRQEDESTPLINWLNGHPDDELVSSALVEVEVPRALCRSEPAILGSVAATLGRVSRIDMDAAVRATAGAYLDPNLRSLDAIHLATAEHMINSGKRLTAFVSYDKRLASAATEVGLTVVAPGTV
jgi:uncharacterized protein